MKYSLPLAAALSASLILGACSEAEQADAAPAETAELATVASGDPLSPEANAFMATLSAEEIGMAYLSCVEPLRSAKAYTKNFDAALAAELDGVENFSLTDLLTSPALKAMSRDEAMTIVEASPKFAPAIKPSESDLAGLKQCVQLARHYHAEMAGR